MTKSRLTDAFCKSVPTPATGHKIFKCADTRGLGLRVTAAGVRSFVFSYSAPSGHERRMTIGRYGTWSVPAARKRAEELRRQVDVGQDPMATNQAAKTAPTVRSLWEWYSSNALLKLGESSQRDVRRAWSTKIEPHLGKHTKLADVRRSDVQALVDSVSKTSGTTVANRCHSYLQGC